MKHLNLLFLAMAAIFTLQGCSNDQNEDQQDENLITITENVTFFQGKSTAHDVDLTITLTIDLEKELVMDYFISDDLETISGISNDELKLLVEQQLGGSEGKLSLVNDDTQNIAKFGDDDETTGEKWRACTEGCIEDFTDDNGDRIKGRGRCKSRCTISAVIDILDGPSDK